MALKHVMINDIIAEHSARMQNLKKYYPFFVLNETTFTQYKEGKYAFLDMGYITMASLRFSSMKTISTKRTSRMKNMRISCGNF